MAIQELIAKTGPKSRADIGRATGTTRATAGKAVARLLDIGVLQISGTPGSDQQRTGFCPQGKLSFTLIEQDFQGHGQCSYNGDATDKDDGLFLVIADVLPSNVEGVNHFKTLN